jgi:uncharacterized membrane protein
VRRATSAIAHLHRILNLQPVKTLLLKYWDRIRSGFWFIPSLMLTAAAALAFGMVGFDQNVVQPGWLTKMDWIYSGGAEGAASVLQTIATSMISIAGVVFSLTLVALTVASSQFGPRLLRNFMRDKANQVVLGAFVSTFLYCLLVLRTVRRSEGDEFVPHVSVTVGVAFAILSVGVLIYFIHHVSVSIQADEISCRVSRELSASITRLFPEGIARPGSVPAREGEIARAELPERFEAESRALPGEVDGYLQIIDADALMELARQENLVIGIEYRPGHYIVKGTVLVRVYPRAKCTDEIAARVTAAFAFGNQRTSGQDVEFSINQLVEIAARALSPGVHDPFTAITCVRRLGSAVSQLARRTIPSPRRLDDTGRLRLIVPTVDPAGIVDAAFNQIRQYARTNTAVTVCMLETITDIARLTRREDYLTALRRHADMLLRGARAHLGEPDDVRDAEDRHQLACAALDGNPGPDNHTAATA